MAQNLDFHAGFGRGLEPFKKPLLQEEGGLKKAGAIR